MNTDVAESEPLPELDFVSFKGSEKPKETFFYERVVGGQSEIVAFGEDEAAGLDGTKWKQVGVGDGTAFVRYLKDCGVKRGEHIGVERAKKIMHDAFLAELEAARGHNRRPVMQTYHFGGASAGTQGAEELIRRKN